MFQLECDLSRLLRVFDWWIRAKPASKEICVGRFPLFENIHAAQKTPRYLLC
jgi:hypothetical protein